MWWTSKKDRMDRMDRLYIESNQLLQQLRIATHDIRVAASEACDAAANLRRAAERRMKESS